ncbi:MAG TPA: peptidoglycan-binding domain-containing protein [Bauldia sp.]|nr:peptidoglycan-binding domain-containing protein [Bauldia sp.]
MQGKSRRRVAVKVEAEAAGEGVVARIVERAIENPAMTGGLFVMALTAAAIVSNAMLLQHGRHPEPLFMTRPAVDDTVPLPRVRAPQAAVVRPAPAPAATAAAAPAAALKPVPDVKTVVSLQKALAAKGLYKGAVDGIAGSRTRAAVAAYEKSAGLPVTGEPSADLLDRITTASIKPVAKGTPAKPAVATIPAKRVAPPADIPAPSASLEPATDIAPVTRMPLPTDPAPAAAAPVAVAAPAPAVSPAAPAGPDPARLAAELRYQQVQDALNRIGYGPLAVTGSENEETANAIRRFELDNGLPISGTANDRVLGRLRTIGAMASN